MKIKTTQTCIRMVKEGDPLWIIVDGNIISPRAGFHIKRTCIPEYANIIRECIERGWLQPVAYMKDTEQTWEILQNGTNTNDNR